MRLIAPRKCATCGKPIEEGQRVYQIEVDSPHVGFTYIHEACLNKKKADTATYEWR